MFHGLYHFIGICTKSFAIINSVIIRTNVLSNDKISVLLDVGCLLNFVYCPGGQASAVFFC